MLRRLGLTVRDNNRKQVLAALGYLSKLKLRIDCWHSSGQFEPVRKWLPPPITAVERDAVTVHQLWLELAKSYWVEIPLPLPLQAADQNAVLLLLTSAKRPPQRAHPDDDRTVVYPQRRQSPFARKIGLSTKNRRARLAACLNRVAYWFERNGGNLMVVYGGPPINRLPPGKIAFLGDPPRVPRWARKDASTKGPERSLRTDPNVASDPSKTDPNVGPTTTVATATEERSSRNDAAGAAELASQVGSLPQQRKRPRHLEHDEPLHEEDPVHEDPFADD